MITRGHPVWLQKSFIINFDACVIRLFNLILCINKACIVLEEFHSPTVYHFLNPNLEHFLYTTGIYMSYISIYNPKFKEIEIIMIVLILS